MSLLAFLEEPFKKAFAETRKKEKLREKNKLLNSFLFVIFDGNNK